MGAGFEPAKAEPTGLQPVPFDRSGIPPGGAQFSVRRVILRAGLLALVLAVIVAPAAGAEPVLKPGVRLWVDPDSSTAQVGSEDARRLAAIPSATWLTGGPPRGDARRVTLAASRRGEVPVIVAYNIPGRDCGEYSAGGAGSAKAYRALDRPARARDLEPPRGRDPRARRARRWLHAHA